MAYRDMEVRRLKDRERVARRTAARLAAGLCPRCGKTEPLPERRLCAGCAGKRNRASRTRDAQLRAEGKPRRNAARARTYQRERSRREVRARRAAGRCVRCGKAPATPERTACEECLEKRRATDRRATPPARLPGSSTAVRIQLSNARPPARPAPSAGRRTSMPANAPGAAAGLRPGAARPASPAAPRDDRPTANSMPPGLPPGSALNAPGRYSAANPAAGYAPPSTPSAATRAGRTRRPENGMPPAAPARPAPIAARRRSAPAAVPPARSGRMRTPPTSGGCRSIRPASRCICAGPRSASASSTTRWRPPPGSPSRSSPPTGSRWCARRAHSRPWRRGNEPPGAGRGRWRKAVSGRTPGRVGREGLMIGSPGVAIRRRSRCSNSITTPIPATTPPSAASCWPKRGSIPGSSARFLHAPTVKESERKAERKRAEGAGERFRSPPFPNPSSSTRA